MYSYFDLIGDVGGFFEALHVLSHLLVAGIASRMFLASLIRELYHVRLDTNHTDMQQLLSKLKKKSGKIFIEDSVSHYQASVSSDNDDNGNHL